MPRFLSIQQIGLRGNGHDGLGNLGELVYIFCSGNDVPGLSSLPDNISQPGNIVTGRFGFEKGMAEIVRLAEWDTIKSNVFARTAIRDIQSLSEVQPLKEIVVLFEQGR